MSTQAVDEFVDTHAGREVGESTMRKYGRWIGRFESWRPGGEPDDEMLRAWDDYLNDEDRTDYPWENARGPSPPASYSYRSRVVSLSAIKLWLKHEFDAPITTEVQNIAEGEPEDFDPTIIPKHEIQATIRNAGAACKNPDCMTAMRVGYDAILRGAEVAGIRREDVDLDQRSLYVRAVKGSERTHVELSPDVFRALKSHMNKHPERDSLFTNAYDNPWKPASWNQHFRRKHHDAGFHAFARHSPITHRLKDGESFGSIFTRARHKDPKKTLKYIGLVPDRSGPEWAGSV